LIKNIKPKIMIKKLTSILVCALLFIEGMMFYNHNSYAYHVSQANGDIHMLANVLEGNSSGTGLKASILEAFNMDSNSYNENQFKNLSKKIVDSTEFAIEIADDIKVVKKLEKAINEINEVQLESINTIQKAIEKIENKEVAEEVGIAYDTAVELEGKVSEAKKEIQTAIDNNQKKIEINIVTSKDKNHHNGHEDGDHKDSENEYDAILLVSADARTEKRKEEDTVQRNANIERINLIEKGKTSQKSAELKRRMEKAQRERAEREKELNN